MSLGRFIDKCGSWPVAAVLVVALIVCNGAFQWRHDALGHVDLPDAQALRSPADLYAILDALGADGRRLYAVSEVTLDLVFPLVYAGLFALLIARLYTAPRARLLLWLPVSTGLFDIAENLALAWLAWNHPDGPAALASAASVLTLLKFAGFLGSVLAVGSGGVYALLGNRSQA